MELGLRDKVAAVTGGSQGIGLAVARGLAAEGVHLALCARDGERVEAVARDIETTYGVRCVAVAADAGQADDLRRFVTAIVQAFGGVDS